MAVTCPKCLRQYDITLFAFGRTVECDCGHVLDGSQRRDVEDPVPPSEEDAGEEE